MSAAPLDHGSNAFIAFINAGSTRRLHPDFGGNVSPGSQEIYGFPYIVVDAGQPKRAVAFLYADESDGVDHTTGQSLPFYPIPDEAITQPHWIEGGPPGNIDLRDDSDRHMIIVDRDRRHLYELFNLFYDGSRWNAGSGAFFDLRINGRRPDGWTSADAAGLAILPGLVRYDEVYGENEIRHAFRVTVRSTNGYVYPASHRAGSTAGALPMGARLRLKAGRDISGFRPEIQKIFRALKRYGLIVADNGSDMYVSGTYDTRWDNDILNPAFRSLTASDFEVVQLGFRPRSLAYFGHVVVGGGYATRITLVNTGGTAAEGELILTASDGTPFVVSLAPSGSSPASPTASLAIVLPPGASQTYEATLAASGPARTGWARVEFTGGNLTGVAVFASAP